MDEEQKDGEVAAGAVGSDGVVERPKDTSITSHTLVGVSIVDNTSGKSSTLELNLISRKGSQLSILDVVRDGASIGRITGALADTEVAALNALETGKVPVVIG